MSFLAQFWALERNENIFSPHKQAVRDGMRWPAVPTLFLVINHCIAIKNDNLHRAIFCLLTTCRRWLLLVSRGCAS